MKLSPATKISFESGVDECDGRFFPFVLFYKSIGNKRLPLAVAGCCNLGSYPSMEIANGVAKSFDIT